MGFRFGMGSIAEKTACSNGARLCDIWVLLPPLARLLPRFFPTDRGAARRFPQGKSSPLAAAQVGARACGGRGRRRTSASAFPPSPSTTAPVLSCVPARPGTRMSRAILHVEELWCRGQGRACAPPWRRADVRERLLFKSRARHREGVQGRRWLHVAGGLRAGWSRARAHLDVRIGRA